MLNYIYINRVILRLDFETIFVNVFRNGANNESVRTIRTDSLFL